MPSEWITRQDDKLVLQGEWTLAHFPQLKDAVKPYLETQAETISLVDIERLDTAGAMLVIDIIGLENAQTVDDWASELPKEQQALLLRIAEAMDAPLDVEKQRTRRLTDKLADIGEYMAGLWSQQRQLLAFIGLVLATFSQTLFKPRHWRLTATVAHIQQSGLNAVPIVILLTFMVGAVVAFLGATVLEDFGATVYTIDLVAFSFLREFGVLLAAILLAGRTASAFTAGGNEIQRRDRRFKGSGARPYRASGTSPGNGAAGQPAAAGVYRYAQRPGGRRAGRRTIAGYFRWSIHDHPAKRCFGGALSGGLEQGAGIRFRHCCYRLSGRLQGQRQCPVGRGTHHVKRGAIHFHGDPDRCAGGTLFHGDGLVSTQHPPNSPATDDDSSAPAIKVRDLENRFGDHVVHESLDLDLLSGEILGVVGGSGTGKSVLLRSIVGLKRPDAGQIEVLGNNLSALDDKERSQIERRFGVLFQQGALFSSLNLQENVALPLIEHAKLEREDAERIARVKLSLVGLEPEAALQYPESLSGGMIKRAALARALALDPDILFLDEPTAGLDPIGAAAFDQLLVTLRDALGFSVFLVTHDLDTLYAACDRVAVLSQKRVLVVDTIDKVADTDDEWIRDYFHGPRGRAAEQSATSSTPQTRSE